MGRSAASSSAQFVQPSNYSLWKFSENAGGNDRVNLKRGEMGGRVHQSQEHFRPRAGTYGSRRKGSLSMRITHRKEEAATYTYVRFGGVESNIAYFEGGNLWN
jgi:hypothetical protein